MSTSCRPAFSQIGKVISFTCKTCTLNWSSASQIGFQSLTPRAPASCHRAQLDVPKQASKQAISIVVNLRERESRRKRKELFLFSYTHTHIDTDREWQRSSLNPKSCSYHPVFLPPSLRLQSSHTNTKEERERAFAPLVPPAKTKCDVQSIRLLLVQSPTPPSPGYGIRRAGWKRIGPALAEAKLQPGDLDPRHHHRVPHGGDAVSGGGGGGAGQQEAADEEQQQHQHHYRLLQLHQEQVQRDQEPPPVPVFQLSHLQAATSVRQPGEYALLSPMGDAAGQSHHHHHGLQTQLLSFGGGNHHHMHQFTAQALPPSQTRPRGGRGGGELVSAAAATPARVRGGGGGGEIVAVQGGHIVRSTGRKDRHSKVCTARGPRDRRVRLSAHTAIQFYDVQDRLGYDRPSKAVDWLIKNAKDAIDSLDTLPAWQPTAVVPAAASNANAAAQPSSSTHPDSPDNSDDQAQAITIAHASFDFGGSGGGGGATGGISFLPPSLDSDSIADTIKSFFPMGGTAGGEASSSTVAAAHSSAMSFQSYTPDLLSRTGSQSQELRLSLQPLPDPMFHHQHQQQQQQQQEPHRSHGHESNGNAQHAIFPGGAANYPFGGGAMWGEQAQSQRMLPWSVPDQGGGGGSTGGYLFNVSQQAAHMQAAALSGQSQFFFQRGPLQSSNNQPSDRGWPETVEADNSDSMQQYHHAGLNPSGSAVGFAPGVSFSGFRIPARIQGDEEHNGGDGDKPPSVSSASHH